jgi:hypothetical protein
VDKKLKCRFGEPRGSDAHYAYGAVILQIVLIWEQTRLAARTASGPLVLLLDGARLLNSTDVAHEPRALL